MRIALPTFRIAESYIVFAFTIAEALISGCSSDRQGYIYGLNPAWSWNDLHQYLCEKAGLTNPVFSSNLKESVLSPCCAGYSVQCLACCEGGRISQGLILVPSYRS